MALIGGAEARHNDPQILRRFAGLCGGDNADIVVFPTASRMKDAGCN
jgi:cyanophycinase